MRRQEAYADMGSMRHVLQSRVSKGQGVFIHEPIVLEIQLTDAVEMRNVPHVSIGHWHSSLIGCS